MLFCFIHNVVVEIELTYLDCVISEVINRNGMDKLEHKCGFIVSMCQDR